MIAQEVEKKMISNSTLVLLDYNSIGKEWINRYHHNKVHVDPTTLADGTYELVPESESEQREAQVNLTEATEDPNQVSEEPKASSSESNWSHWRPEPSFGRA